MIVWALAVLALVGWGIAGRLAFLRARHICPFQPPTKAVLLSRSGLPESMRSLKGAAPATYSRPHGKGPAILYQRVGTAALYQPPT